MTPRMSRAIRRRLPDHVHRSGAQSICRRSSPSGETVLNVLACVLGSLLSLCYTPRQLAL
jgi:hypothetical protein